MEAYSDHDLVSNHQVSDGTEDVVLLDSAATISTDLTEATNEDQKINLRSAKDEDVASRDDEDSSDESESIKSMNEDQNIDLRSAKDADVASRSDEDSSDGSDDHDDDDNGKKDETQNDRKRKHEVLPVSTDDMKSVTIGPKELGERLKDLLYDKLPISSLDGRSQMNNASEAIYTGQNSTQKSEVYLSAIAKLCVENMILRNQLDTAVQTLDRSTERPLDPTTMEPLMEPKIQKPDTFENFHLVYCARARRNYYRDVPRMFKGDLISDHLRGQHGLPQNLTNFLEENQEILFASTKSYYCACHGGPTSHGTVGYRDGKLVANSPPAESKYVRVVLGPRIHKIIKGIIKSHAEKFKGYSAVPMKSSEPPHRLFFNHNKTLLDIANSSDVNESDRSRVQMLCNWFETNHREDWDEARELMSRGKINPKHYTKLFGPDELYVSPAKDDPDVLEVFKSKEYPWPDSLGLSMENYGWDFNGRFYKTNYSYTLVFPRPFVSDEAEVDITALRMYPLRFAEPGIKEKLIARGHKFWNCRTRSLVCYRESGESPTLGQAEKRFMVDYTMFRRIYPTKSIFNNAKDDLGEEAMNKTEQPDDNFLVMLPPYVYGFDIDSKAWRSIRIDRTTAVTWNKEAFKRLVIAPDTKEMLLAAITSHGAQNGPATDVIAGKGQGLLILLHGGPGTGKTLTAESIAEAQEKPLYRVTCGDIGMEPEDVEVYLRSVLEIGKAWECVVLLDEADVFLEARTVPNQKQNAIVSVFLRMLEYYNGILILTSNRVATFDEAFKSRIHLPIRYPDLDEDQRVKIWSNFLEVLKKSKERVDFADLESNVPYLAQRALNGRQIRNSIQMARYLARYRKQMMVYKHVQDAVAAVMKFDGYLEEFLGPDDVWARQERLR